MSLPLRTAPPPQMTTSHITLDRLTSTVESITGARVMVRGDQGEGFCVVCESDGQHRTPSAGYRIGENGEVVAFCHKGCDSVDLLRRLDLRAERSAPWLEPAPRDGWPDAIPFADWIERSHQALLCAPEAAPARAYLRARGVDGDLVRRYRLGFAIEGDEPAPGFKFLRNRVVYCEFPHIAEGRSVPGLEAVTYKPERKAQPALGSRKRWWRVEEVDVHRPVIAVEGFLDVLGLDRIAGPQAIATLGKGNVNVESIRRLVTRGLQELLVCLDADATPNQWKRMLTLCSENGLKAVPVVGPANGSDFGDLLALEDDGYFPAASEALKIPEAA